MRRSISLIVLAVLAGALSAFAQEAPAEVAPAEAALAAAEATQLHLNFAWTVLAAVLVFFMQAGFALLETGFTRSKNAVNIIMKNVMDVSAGAVVFFVLGFGLMFGTSLGGWIGTDGFFLAGLGGDPWTYAFFLFQAVFAATAATIVSGAVAERTKFTGYLLFSVVITGLIYPVFGSWAWGGLFNGGGWLEGLGFIDFAGSTVVHSVGGWAALAGALVVGPRVGKYDENGNPRHIPGHSLPLAALGVFILWFGWFGFNAGSTTEGSTDIALIAMNTFLAAGAGATAAMLVSWIRGGKPDAPMTLNGVLGGLVGITAGCANLTPGFALLTGAIAGVVVVYATLFLDRYVDDPVGAVAVHGVCGAWGTLAAGMFDSAGLFNPSVIGVQLVGIAAAFLWTFPVSYLLFTLIKKTIGLRVNGHLEHLGLDLHEHDNQAYPEFVPTDELTLAEV
ncbi:ammonium transporter [Rhodocaloribacter litoris]|uniref:ammonium transporter n=1 Tax=Rhodocaloribacter litoris TaxID=2558931 RepID=UPI0014202944|nr:ammonium transporter [Rhodocaloribacter litoris]QXD15041.1 ammonium transporter [Rhodocaloribacter litoris]